MLTTNNHADDRDRHEDRTDDEDIEVHYATNADAGGLLQAFREAVEAARIVRQIFLAHGIGPDRATVTATLTDQGQALVLVTALPHGVAITDGSCPDPSGVADSVRSTSPAGGAGGPPTEHYKPGGRAA